MGFDWSTFVLEVINFLILVWILAHFFYRPVAAAIEQRRQAIETSLEDAKRLHEKAEAMQRQYEARLADWEAEKRQAREVWLSELDGEKTRQLEVLRQTLKAEREQAEVLEQRRLRTRQTELEIDALALGGRFAARLLERIASPELEARLVDLFLEELAGVPEDRWQTVAAAFADSPARAVVRSAFVLSETQRADLQQALSSQLGRPVECEFLEDPRLTAGIRVELGPVSLNADIGDELSFFAAAG